MNLSVFQDVDGVTKGNTLIYEVTVSFILRRDA